MTEPRLAHRPIHAIAKDIRQNWPKPYFGAVPYLTAMSSLTSVHDRYYEDSAKSVILYFLSNASTFRGEKAKTLKSELKQIAGIK